MAKSELSPLQKSFINAVFGAADGNLKLAAEIVGISDYSSIMTQDLVESIKSRADQEIAMNVPRAVLMMSKILNEPDSVPFIEGMRKAAESVLDRSGLSKQERPQTIGTSLGLVFLPNTSVLPPPPTEEEDNAGIPTEEA